MLKSPSMVGYGPDVSGINGNLDFRVAHGETWASAAGQKRVQPASQLGGGSSIFMFMSPEACGLIQLVPSSVN